MRKEVALKRREHADPKKAAGAMKKILSVVPPMFGARMVPLRT
jgi:hypothetical protein